MTFRLVIQKKRVFLPQMAVIFGTKYVFKNPARYKMIVPIH